VLGLICRLLCLKWQKSVEYVYETNQWLHRQSVYTQSIILPRHTASVKEVTTITSLDSQDQPETQDLVKVGLRSVGYFLVQQRLRDKLLPQLQISCTGEYENSACELNCQSREVPLGHSPPKVLQDLHDQRQW